MTMTCGDLEWWTDSLGDTMGLRWFDPGTDELFDLTGKTFKLELRRPRDTIVNAPGKTTGMQGGDGGVDGDDPNLVVTWSPADVAGLSGFYWVRITEETYDISTPLFRVRFREP